MEDSHLTNKLAVKRPSIQKTEAINTEDILRNYNTKSVRPKFLTYHHVVVCM